MITQIEYQNKVVSLLSPKISASYDIAKEYLGLKLNSEFGEFTGEIAKKVYHNKPVSKDKFIEEAGDCTWYIYNLINLHFGVDYEEIYNEIDSYNNNIDNNNLPFCCDVARRSLNNFLNGEGDLSDFIGDFIRIIQALGLDYYEILEKNLEKLAKRHGDSFNSEFYTASTST